MPVRELAFQNVKKGRITPQKPVIQSKMGDCRSNPEIFIVTKMYP